MLQYLLARAREPSSYAGLATLLSATGVSIAPAEWQAIVGALTAIAGLIAIFAPDLGATQSPPVAKS